MKIHHKGKMKKTVFYIAFTRCFWKTHPRKTPLLLGVALIAACLMTACARHDHNVCDQQTIVKSYTFPGPITSVNTDGNGKLLLGMTNARFIRYNPACGHSQTFQLPSSLADTRTYCILPLSDASFLVSKRDHGVTYVEYPATNDDAEIAPIKTVRLEQDSVMPPFKGSSYSAYSMRHLSQDTILIGTTNGLVYTTLAQLHQADSIARIPFVEVLRHHRDNTTQFPIIEINRSGEQLTVATDDLRWDFNHSLTPARHYTEIAPWTSSTDSIYCFTCGEIALDHPDNLRHKLSVAPGHGSKTPRIDSVLYYISDFRLRSVKIPALKLLKSHFYSPLHLAAAAPERMYFANCSGLYEYHPGEAPEFLHSLNGLTEVRDAIVFDDDIYYIDEHALYRIAPRYRFNPWPLGPQVIDSIPAHDNGNGDEEFNCLAFHGDRFLIGGRNEMHVFSLKEKKLTTLPPANSRQDYINPYFTTIAYPFAGTLSQGIFLIGNSSYRPVLGGILDVRQLVYNDSTQRLAMRTNNAVSLWQYSPKNENLTPLAEIRCDNNAPFHIALADSTLYLLDHASLRSYPIHADTLLVPTLESNPCYHRLALLGDQLVKYSPLSMVDGHTLQPRYVNWWLVLLAAAGILLVISITKMVWFKQQSKASETELSRHRSSPDYHAAKHVLTILNDHPEYIRFRSTQPLDGTTGHLRRYANQLIDQAKQADNEGDSELFMARMRQFTYLARTINDRFRSLSQNLESIAPSLNSRIDNVLCAETRQPTAEFFNSLLSIASTVQAKLPNEAEHELIISALQIIDVYERLYNLILTTLDIDRFQALSQKVVVVGDNDAVDDFNDRLTALRGYFASLSSQINGTLALFHPQKPQHLYFYWDGFLLISLTLIDIPQIRAYLRCSHPSMGIEQRKRLFNLNDRNTIIKYLQDSMSPAVYRHNLDHSDTDILAYIPLQPLDLLAITAIRFTQRLS